MRHVWLAVSSITVGVVFVQVLDAVLVRLGL